MVKKTEHGYIVNKKKYINKFNHYNYMQVIVRIRYDDVIVLDKLAQVKSKNAYILDLIRKDAMSEIKV